MDWLFQFDLAKKNMLKVSLRVFYQHLNIHFTHITAMLSSYGNQSVDFLNKSIDFYMMLTLTYNY